VHAGLSCLFHVNLVSRCSLPNWAERAVADSAPNANVINRPTCAPLDATNLVKYAPLSTVIAFRHDACLLVPGEIAYWQRTF
jgi:hypothetical protein